MEVFRYGELHGCHWEGECDRCEIRVRAVEGEMEEGNYIECRTPGCGRAIWFAPFAPHKGGGWEDQS